MIPPLPTPPLPPPMIPPLPSPPPLEPPVLFFPCLRRVPPPSRYSPLPTHATVLSLHSGSVGLPPTSSHLQPHQMVSSDLSNSKSILLEPLQWLQLLSSNPTFILGIFVVYDLIQGFWASSSTSSPSASTGGSRTSWRPGYWDALPLWRSRCWVLGGHQSSSHSTGFLGFLVSWVLNPSIAS
ncbi:unnamed protein product [Linum trigynum]|uniref:Uncharacterized protein n=1 Tax=Linum trigynum TaxID=586398 RepID=A0AAV2FHT0_9ROSI